MDSRRVQAPVATLPYNRYVKKAETSNLKSRKDGRKFDELRKIAIKMEMVNRAKGSAYVEFGQTKVICSVFDPRKASKRTECADYGLLYCDFKFAPFSCSERKGYAKDAEERDYSNSLRCALESAVIRSEFPNCQVDIYVLIIENDGCPLAAAITCASMALINASIPMYDLVTAVSMGIYDGKRILDPTLEEERLCSGGGSKCDEESGLITVAYCHGIEQVPKVVQCGNMDANSCKECVQTLIQCNISLHDVCKAVLYDDIRENMKDFS